MRKMDKSPKIELTVNRVDRLTLNEGFRERWSQYCFYIIPNFCCRLE